MHGYCRFVCYIIYSWRTVTTKICAQGAFLDKKFKKVLLLTANQSTNCRYVEIQSEQQKLNTSRF